MDPLKLKAIEGAYIALDYIKKSEMRRKQVFREIHKLASVIDPEDQPAVIGRLRELHDTGIPLVKAQEHILGVDAMIATFRKKLQRTSKRDPASLLARVNAAHPELDAPNEPFARTRAAAAPKAAAAPAGSLDELDPCGPDSDHAVQRPPDRS
ncbi:MAG: hypothetical protein ACR2RF_03615 [Geminicoccaceae bacterium]